MFRPHRQAGFTLVELMVIVIMIGVMVALAAPSLHGALADARARELGNHVANVHNSARARAAGTGLAQLVAFNSADDGSVTHFEGNTSTCATSAWATIMGAGCAGNRRCRYQVSSDELEMGSDRLILDMRTIGSGFDTDTADMCYEPTGLTHWRTDATGLFSAEMGQSPTDATGLDGGFRYRVRRLNGGTAISGARHVIAPLGASARRVM